jgi:hypothetical protein
MPPPAFGFGVGDFITVAGLIWQLCQSLDSASEDSKIFRDIQFELFAFNGVIFQMQQSIANGVELPDGVIETLQKTLDQAKRTIIEFGRHVDTFKTGPVDEGGVQSIAELRKRISWSFSGKKKVMPFRQSMQSYSAVLMLIMQNMNRFVAFLVGKCPVCSQLYSDAMRCLERRVKSQAEHLSLQLRTNTGVNLQINNAVEEPWDQKPIRFQDAIGRRYPLPLEVCGTFEVWQL